MTINKQTFETLNNKSFEIAFDSNKTTTIELIEIKSINCGTLNEGQTEPFSLLFQTSGDIIHEQNTYNISNNEFDTMPLFLVPVGADENGVRYEAVFT